MMDRSLEMLVDVDLEEEGILRLLFAAVHLMFQKAGNDNDISAASRYKSIFIFSIHPLKHHFQCIMFRAICTLNQNNLKRKC